MDWLKNEVYGMSFTSLRHWKAEIGFEDTTEINAPCLAKPLEWVGNPMVIHLASRMVLLGQHSQQPSVWWSKV